jgi:hypothetical protein
MGASLPLRASRLPALTHQCLIAQANNALGQSPCLVVAKLVAQCFNQANYSVVAIDSDGEYLNSDNPAPCMCTDSAYSLFAACGDCQGAKWLNWGQWTTKCTSTSLTYQGDIPPDTQIPGWATLNIEVHSLHLVLEYRWLTESIIEYGYVRSHEGAGTCARRRLKQLLDGCGCFLFRCCRRFLRIRRLCVSCFAVCRSNRIENRNRNHYRDWNYRH